MGSSNTIERQILILDDFKGHKGHYMDSSLLGQHSGVSLQKFYITWDTNPVKLIKMYVENSIEYDLLLDRSVIRGY